MMTARYSDGYYLTKANIDNAKFTTHGNISPEDMRELCRAMLHDLLNQDYLEGVVTEEENEVLHQYIDRKFA
jgi:hypothetical protein